MSPAADLKPLEISAPLPAGADGAADYVETPSRAIGTKLAVIARQLRQGFDERVEAMGVTRAKFLLIATVSRNPGVTQRVIAQKLEVTDVTAGRLIDRVCVDGLIERRENPDDRRAYCVYLTPAAQPMLDALAATVGSFEQQLFAGFDEDEICTLNGLLGKLAVNVSAMRGETSRRPPL